MRQSHIILLVLVPALVFTGLCCQDVGGPVPDKTFALTAEDASCTETWLKLRIRVGSASREVILEIINRGLYETIYKNYF